MMQGEIKRPPQRPVQRPIIKQDIIRTPIENKEPPIDKKTKKKLSLKWIIIGVIGIIVILGGAYTAYYFIWGKNNNTLPYPISKSAEATLGFDIYYPDQKLLPSGYVLDKNSFSFSDQTIIYTVSYGNNQKLVFSDQTKPSDSEIQTFYAKRMPLNTSLSTSVGKATIGAINSQTVASLPTNTNAWLLITGPSDTNQQNLNQVLKSIRLSK